MEWSVAKIGSEMFDALHAYGLGIVLAYAGKAPVELRDKGPVYRLYSSAGTLPHASALADILALPTPGQLQTFQQNQRKAHGPLANLDGLLASLFTVPGVRLVSISDLLDKQKQRPSVVQRGLAKVSTAISGWQKYIKRKSRHSPGWLSHALQDYDPIRPTVPFTHRKRTNDISVLMTIDPSFSFSTSRSVSDGLITDKTNIAVHGTQYATLFARIGAARFLRAQRVAKNWVNFYIPLVGSMALNARTAMPVLYSTPYPPGQAAVYQWLTCSQMACSSNIDLRGLAYQTLQTQGPSQSISISRGYLDNLWLMAIEEQLGPKLANYWKFLLSNRREQLSFEIDNLADFLANRCPVAWTNHLRDISVCLHNNPKGNVRPYSLKEIREVMVSMNASKNVSLSVMLKPDGGTLRFGHALRLLGQVNNGALREIIDSLDTAQTTNQLIRILALAAQECAVAGAKSQFIIVPNDDDLKHLLDDLEQHGAQTVAGLLIILSALRYPRSNLETNTPEHPSAQSIPESKGGKTQ